MRHTILLLAGVTAVLFGLNYSLGHGPAYELAYGAISILGAMISLTFLWLYIMRMTPLALGMAFSWAGAALVMGWWWAYRFLGTPNAMLDSPVLFLFLALYMVGAMLHFFSIERAFGWHRGMMMGAMAFAGLGSTAVHILAH